MGTVQTMAINHVAVIEAESASLIAALRADPEAKIPWSDHWTVASCARHVASAHHVVARIVVDRPTADFSLFSTLAIPDADDPLLADWFARGTSDLVAALQVTDDDAECWSFWPAGRTAGFWRRRMAQETLVHRWDAELAAGIRSTPMDPETAADGVDEYVDVFAGLTRRMHNAPPGPSIHLHCTDTEGEWLLRFPTEGKRVMTREHGRADVALRGPAEGLLLMLWGRLDPDAAAVEIVGDASVVDRRAELLPPI
jgi:uncharacterized protein (TIGR03083 family)